MKKKHIKIAIMGAKQAGKTVLLTAIHNRLKYLEEKQQGELCNGWWVHECNRVYPSDGNGALDDFPVDAYEDCYLCGQGEKWPDSTTKPARLCYELTLRKNIGNSPLKRLLYGGDMHERRLCIEFLDLPGERMTDIATMRDRSFLEWSKIVCKTCDNSKIQGVPKAFEDYRRAVVKIIEKPEQGDWDSVRKEICEEYKKVVATLMKKFSPFITPSDMQLDENGQTSEYSDDEEQLAKQLHDVGFAPLPERFFDGKHKELVRSFEDCYDKYQEKKRALFNWLDNVDQIYFLVDVLGILECGRGRYAGVRGQIDLAFPKKDSWLHWLWKGFCGRNISRICMVATQVDRTNIKRDEANITKLLKTLFRHVNQCSRVGLKKETLLCSAMKSTDDLDTGSITGTFEFSEGNRKTGAIPVPEVPEEFDFTGKYSWPSAVPLFCRSDEKETPDYNLNELLARMLCISKNTTSSEE